MTGAEPIAGEPRIDGAASGDEPPPEAEGGSRRNGRRGRKDRRRPGRLRRWVLRPLLWGLAALALLIFVLQQLLDTRWVRDSARDLLTSKLTAALDREIQLVDLSFTLLPLSVEIWGFVIAGPDPDGPNFIEVPFAAIDADLSALKSRRIHLQEVRVQRPVVYLEFFPDGTHNMIKRGNKVPGPRRFDVYVDRLEIERADFGLDQQGVKMSIAADGMRLRTRGVGEMHLAGQLDAHSVVIRLPNARPVTVAVSGRGFLRRGLIEIESARISGPDISANGSGTCEYPRGARERRKCLFQARGRAQGALLAELGYFQDLSGSLDFDGTVTWRPRTTGWRSRLTAAGVEIWDRQVEDLSGSLVADRYGFRIGIDEARYAGGLVNGEVAWESKEEGKPWTVDLGFRGLELDRLLADQQIPTAGYASRAAGRLYYRFLAGEAERGEGSGEIELVEDPDHPGLPLTGDFPLRITRGTVRTDSISLSSERQSILAGGWYDFRTGTGRYDYEITSAEVAELTPLLLLDDSAGPPLWLPTSARGDLEGTLYIVPDPADSRYATAAEASAGGESGFVLPEDRLRDGTSADMRLRLESVVAPGATTRRVTGAMHLTADAARSLRLDLGDGDEALLVRGDMPYEPDALDPIVLDFDAVDWPLDEVRPWLDFELPVGGRISGHMALVVDDLASSGQLEASVAPASLRLNGAPETADGGTTEVTVAADSTLPFLLTDVDLDSLSGRLEWDADRIRFDSLLLAAPSGTVTCEGTHDWTSGALDLGVRSPSLQLSQAPLADYLPRGDISGDVSIEGRLGGWLRDPRLDLVVAADDLALGERTLEGRPSRLEVRWDGGRVETAGRLLDMVTLKGGGTLEPQRADLAFVLDGNDLHGLAELVLEDPPADLEGRFTGALVIRGDGEAPVRIELELAELEVTLRDRVLASREPVRATLEAEHLVIHSLRLGEAETRTEFSLTGHLGYFAPTSLDLELESTLSSRWLELLDLGVDVGGTLDLDGRLGGTFEAPTFEGRGELRGGRVALSEELPLEIVDLEGHLSFLPGQAVLERLEGRLGGGRVVLDGQATLPRADEPMVYRMQLSGTDLDLRYLEGWSVRGGVELALASTDVGHLLDGRVQLAGLEYSEDIRANFEQIMRSFLQRQRLEIHPTDTVLSTIALNIEVDAPDALVVRNNVADLTGSAQLLIRGNMAAPVLYGEVEIDPEGTLLYNSTDYEIERGRVVFANPYELDPEVDLVAVTRVREFDVTLAVDGTFDRLETRFSSEPPLPDLEVFRLLASGGDATTETTLAVPQRTEIEEDPSTSAATFLYGQAASVIGQRVNSLFGFDKFRIDPLTGSGDQLSKARVTVGKRLSKDVFVTFSADPSSTEDQRLQIEWQVSPGLSLILTQNGDDGYSADARWESSF